MRRLRRALTATLALGAGAMIVGCGGSGAGGASGAGNGPLMIGSFQPYTGPDAAYGPEGNEICAVATNAINAAGGVLGHKFSCGAFDSTSDPADAVPVANRMIASNGNLKMIYGPTQIEPAVEQQLNTAKIVHFPDNGDPRYDHQTSPYFVRVIPSDALAGVAVALYAIKHGSTHAASVFTSAASAQTEVPALRAAYAKHGGKLAVDLTITPGQPSYRTEVARVLAAHPDVVMTEMDAQTAATFLSEMQQLNNGKLLPIISTSAALDSTWVGGVLKAVGKTAFQNSITAVATLVGANGPGYAAFVNGLMKAPQAIANRAQYKTDPYSQATYDGFTMGALAMLQAGSTDAAKWAPLIPKISNGSPGAVLVHDFTQGKAAIAAGKTVHYVGASGPIFLNRWNSPTTPFAGYKYDGQGNGLSSLKPTAGSLSAAEIAQG